MYVINTIWFLPCPIYPTEPCKKKRKTTLKTATMVRQYPSEYTPYGDKETDHVTSSDAEDSREDMAEASARIPVKKPSGIILRGGRVRLPDKLMEYLNKEVVPDVLYWQEGGKSFSFDSKTAQAELLDKYFGGTKLSSFTRSLNRWGFKRVFHALLPKSVLSYEHPYFKRDFPELVKDMKMASAQEDVRMAQMAAAAAARKELKQTSQPVAVAVPTSPSPRAAAPVPSVSSPLLAALGVATAGTATSSSPQPSSVNIAAAIPNLLANMAATAPLTSASAAAPSQQQSVLVGLLSPAVLQNLVANTHHHQQQQPNHGVPQQQSQQRTAAQLAVQALMANQQQSNLTRNLSLQNQTNLPTIIQTALGMSQNNPQTQTNQAVLLNQLGSLAQRRVSGNNATANNNNSLQQTLLATASSEQEQQRQAAIQLLVNVLLQQHQN